MFASLDDLRRFISGLRIPEQRKRDVEIELIDHVESRVSSGVSETEALAALGDPDRLRGALERIEPALDPAGAVLRGLACALTATAVFAISSVLVPRHGSAANLAAAIPTALCGLVVLWLLAPRAIGAAVRAEVGATVESRVPATARRRAVVLFVGIHVAVFLAIWGAWVVGLPDRVRGDLLYPWGLLWLGYGTYALLAFRRARAVRALVRT
jgi:hypothetical protein